MAEGDETVQDLWIASREQVWVGVYVYSYLGHDCLLRQLQFTTHAVTSPHLIKRPFHSSTLSTPPSCAFQRLVVRLDFRSVIDTFPSWSPAYNKVLAELNETVDNGAEWFLST